MKAIVDTKQLQAALTRLKVVTSAKTTPAIGGVLLEAGGSWQNSIHTLRLSGTDLDTHLRITIPAEVRGNGTALISPRLLQDFAKGTKSVELAANPPKKGETYPEVTIEAAATTTLKGLDPTEAISFPECPRDAVCGTVPGEVIKAVMPAASPDFARPLLTSVVIDGQFVFATDSYRMHVVQLLKRVFYVKDKIRDLKLPCHVLAQLLKAKPREGELGYVFRTEPLKPVRPKKGPQQERSPIEAWCTVESAAGVEEWHLRCLDGRYPDWEALVGDLWTEGSEVVTYDSSEMIEAIQLCQPMVRDSTTPVVLKMVDGELEVSVTCQDVGTTSKRIPAKAGLLGVDPDDKIAFNPIYLKDLLAGFETVTMWQKGNPVKLGYGDITGIRREAEGFSELRIIMPVRVS